MASVKNLQNNIVQPKLCPRFSCNKSETKQCRKAKEQSTGGQVMTKKYSQIARGTPQH